MSCGYARELRRLGFSLLFVCRASSQRPIIERIQSHCRTQAMTCVSSHSPFYSVPFILSKREVRLSRCGWRRFYLLIALVRGVPRVGLLCFLSQACRCTRFQGRRTLSPRKSGRMTLRLQLCLVPGLLRGEQWSIHYNSITSNNDTSCNESLKEIGKTTLGEQVIPVLFPRVRVCN